MMSKIWDHQWAKQMSGLFNVLADNYPGREGTLAVLYNIYNIHMCVSFGWMSYIWNLCI